MASTYDLTLQALDQLGFTAKNRGQADVLDVVEQVLANLIDTSEYRPHARIGIQVEITGLQDELIGTDTKSLELEIWETIEGPLHNLIHQVTMDEPKIYFHIDITS